MTSVTLKSSSALRASSSVLPTTSGTGRRSGPPETSIFTALPDSDSEPPSGDCEMTRLIATLSENDRVSSISKPAAVSVLRACNRPSPMTSGTLTIAGPSETRIVIVDPSSTVVPPSGSWPKTVLRGLSDVSRTASTAKPSLVRRCWATEIDAPTTLGTATCLGVKTDTSSPIRPSRSRPPSTSQGQRLRALRGGIGGTGTAARRGSTAARTSVAGPAAAGWGGGGACGRAVGGGGAITPPPSAAAAGSAAAAASAAAI